MASYFKNDTKILVLPEDWDDSAMEQLQIPNLVSIIELEKLKFETETKYRSSKQAVDKLRLINFNRLILSIRQAYLID